MRTKGRTFMSALVTLLALTAMAIAGAATAAAVESDDVVFNIVGAIPAEVSRSGEIALPTGTAVRGGVTKEILVSVYDPFDDLVIAGKGSFYPAATGEYTIRYKANFGKTYVKEEKFVVKHDPSVLFGGTGVTAEADATAGPLFATQHEGVLLTANVEGATATYALPLDLSHSSKTDALISLLVVPSAKGTLDFDRFTVTLTDKYNSDNAVKIINYRGSWGYHTSYVRAAANKQGPAGYENDQLLNATTTGTPIWFSFTAEPDSGNASGDKLLCTYMYDNEEKAVYISNPKRTTSSARPGLVTDFDSLDCQPASQLWGGFTTGEVYLSITFESFVGSSASILVTEVNGVSMSSAGANDTVAPAIYVDTEGYDEAPAGIVGVRYPVFAATALDKLDGAIKPKLSVYKDYGTAAASVVAMRVSDSFVPSSEGRYSLVYSATDASGNYAEKAIAFNVVSALDMPSITFGTEVPDRAFVGEKIELPTPDVVGGSGRNTVNAYVRFGNERIDGRSIVPKQAGEYVYVVEATDRLGRKAVSENAITVTVSDAPVIDDPVVTPIMVSGSVYKPELPRAVDYKAGGAEVAVTLKARYASGEEVTVSGDGFTPDIQKGDAVTLIYSARSATGEESAREVEIRIVDGGTNALARKAYNYFLHDGFTAEQGESYISYKRNDGDGEIEFAHDLLARNFRIDLTVPASGNSFNALKITLTDPVNADETLTWRIYRGDNESASSSVLEAEGESGSRTVSGSFFDVVTTGFSVAYNNADLSLVDVNRGATITKLENFSGFSSGKLRLKIALEGVYGESELRVGRVGNQNFVRISGSGDTITDNTAPDIALAYAVPRSGEHGKEITVPAAMVADVLSSTAQVKLVISAPDNSTVYDGDIASDYTFVPDGYGAYRVSYVFDDGSRGYGTLGYQITVKDAVPPTITVNGGVPQTASLGSDISLPTASVTDNNDTNLECMIFVTDPRGTMKPYVSGAKYQYAGKYTITYYCYDSYRAFTIVSYTVTVA